jgi:kynurenine formamidase
MKATIAIDNLNFKVDFSQPIDISIPLSDTTENPIAWYLDKPKIEAVVAENWVGKVALGASTNFNNITFNPHGHGTHTECLGHITRDFYSVNKALQQFLFVSKLISVTPEKQTSDLVITKLQLETILQNSAPCAIIIRTLPNDISKKSKHYSHSNPPYLAVDAALYLREMGVLHLLIDLPSVDKEKDEGKLLAHKAFWNVIDPLNLNPEARHQATITEMVYIDNHIVDGDYLLNLQIASFENDATPSKPVLYKIM